MTDREMLDTLTDIVSKAQNMIVSINNDLLDQRTIKSVILDYFNVSETIFDSKSRDREECVMPRQFYYLFGRSLLNISLQRLGFNAGHKDHATALHGIDKVCDLLETGDRDITLHYEHLLLLMATQGYDPEKVKRFVREHRR